MKLEYQNWNGCKNEYSFLDFTEKKLEFSAEKLKELAQKISSQEKNDGMILLLPAEDQAKAQYRMRIFNADGSEAEMCGNGIRCLAALIDQRFGPKDEIVIETIAGLRPCTILDRQDPNRVIVKVNMGRPTFIPSKIPVLFEDVVVMDEEFEVDDKLFRVSCVNIGNPHCVIEVPDLQNFDVAKYGPLIEKHEAFPEGVNVEFIHNNQGEVSQRTWERGSGETQACGTGACAVGVTLIMRNRVDSPVDIQLKGGTLRVEWDGLREVWMTGEAVPGEMSSIEF